MYALDTKLSKPIPLIMSPVQKLLGTSCKNTLELKFNLENYLIIDHNEIISIERLTINLYCINTMQESFYVSTVLNKEINFMNQPIKQITCHKKYNGIYYDIKIN